MIYTFFTFVGDTKIEISVKHTALSFKYEKFNNRLSWNFKKTLNTELVFVDDPRLENTSKKINKSFSFVKQLLGSFVQRIRIQIYRKNVPGVFWDGYINLINSDSNAWDFDKNVFRGKGTQSLPNFSIEELGDKEVNVQLNSGKITCTDSDGTSYDNGQGLKNAFDFLFSESDISLGSLTDILPIIPTLNLDNVVIWDKSDAKRPTAANNATTTTITLNTLIDNICNLFNVKYTVIVNGFQFRHYTENFRNTIDISDFVLGNYNDSFSFVEVPKIENLKTEEAKNSPFLEQQIEYEIEGGSKEEYKVSNVCVDLGFIIQNRDRLASDPDAKDDIADNGLFIAGVDGSNIIQDAGGLKNGNLAYDNIFPLLWARDRYLNRYKINGAEQGAATIDRKIKRRSLDVVFFEGFNPENLFTTKYGMGEIETAELKGNKLTLNLLFGGQ